MNKMIVALCGKRRVGKDTAAEHLTRVHGMAHVKVAQNLKDACEVMFGFTKEQMEHEKDVVDDRWEVTPRQVMQFLGTDMMQFKIQELFPSMGRMFWIRSMFMNMPRNRDIVISDIRFLHEVKELRKRGAYIIKIHKTNNNMSDVDAHVSETETELIEADFVINNNGSIADLHRGIEKIMADIRSLSPR